MDFSAPPLDFIRDDFSRGGDHFSFDDQPPRRVDNGVVVADVGHRHDLVRISNGAVGGRGGGGAGVVKSIVH
jgi:hypothetical protein